MAHGHQAVHPVHMGAQTLVDLRGAYAGAGAGPTNGLEFRHEVLRWNARRGFPLRSCGQILAAAARDSSGCARRGASIITRSRALSPGRRRSRRCDGAPSVPRAQHLRRARRERPRARSRGRRAGSPARRRRRWRARRGGSKRKSPSSTKVVTAQPPRRRRRRSRRRRRRAPISAARSAKLARMRPRLGAERLQHRRLEDPAPLARRRGADQHDEPGRERRRAPPQRVAGGEPVERRGDAVDRLAHPTAVMFGQAPATARSSGASAARVGVDRGDVGVRRPGQRRRVHDHQEVDPHRLELDLAEARDRRGRGRGRGCSPSAASPSFSPISAPSSAAKLISGGPA